MFPLPVRHLINVLYCAEVPGSNINTYIHKPGAFVWAFSTLRPDFLRLRKGGHSIWIAYLQSKDCSFFFFFFFTFIQPKNTSPLSSFHYQQTETTKSIYKRQITERIRFPHALYGILCWKKHIFSHKSWVFSVYFGIANSPRTPSLLTVISGTKCHASLTSLSLPCLGCTGFI